MSTSFRNRTLAVIAVCSSFGTFSAKADLASGGVDLGAAGRTKQWAVLSLSGDVTMSGGSFTKGDVGAAGGGTVDMSGNAAINGDLYQHTDGKFNRSGKAKVTGMRHQDAASDALLDQAIIDANNASDAAFALPVTPAYASLTKVKLNGSNNITITGSGCVVLKLTDFVLSGSSTFTLQGTAGTSFIFNVTNQFSLSGSSKIVLGPGINPQDVLFNVRNTGSTAALSGSSSLSGVLMANKRTVDISGSAKVKGEVIAKAVVLSGTGNVVTPSSNP